MADHDLQTIQRLLGHTDIKTTMIYLQTVPTLTLKQAKSPLDCVSLSPPPAQTAGQEKAISHPGPRVFHLHR
jgi:hypothetical protein